MTTATLTLTRPSLPPASVTVSSSKPFARFPGSGLGVFFLKYSSTDEFALWLQLGAVDSKGNAIGGGFDYNSIRVEFDEATDSIDGRCVREHAKAYTLVQPAPQPHFMPWGGQSVRRFYKHGGTWSAPLLTRDPGPLKSRTLSLPSSPAFYDKRGQRLKSAVVSGSADKGVGLWRARIGLFHTPGDPEPGAPGGEGISFVWGYEVPDTAAWFHRQMMDLTIDRQRTACFDSETGRQITAEDWVARAGSVPWYRMSESVLKPQPQSATSPEFAPLTQQHTSYDDEHLVRALGPAIAAWSRYRDPVAQKFIEQLAHHSRGVRCELPGHRLAGELQNALQRPGSASSNLGRAFGWHLFAQACAVWCGVASKGILANGNACVKLFEASAMVNGLAGRNTAQYSSGGITTPWDIGLWSKAFDHVQPFEARIYHNALYAWLAQTLPSFSTPPSRIARILGLIHPAAKLMLKAVDQLTANDRLGVHSYQYNLWSKSPPKYVVVADAGGKPHRTLQMGGADVQDDKPANAKGDPTFVLHDLALAYRMSGDAKYLERIRALDVPAPTLKAKKDALLSTFIQSGSDDQYLQAEQGRAWSLEALSVIP